MLKIFFAFLAGILTVGAPCVLPLLPILLGTSVGQTNRIRPLFITFGFIITFSAVALLFTLFTQVLGISQDALRMLALVMLVIFGLLLIWPAPFERLSLYLGKYTNKASEVSEKAGNGNFGGFILGIMLGIIWTPCAGPVLGSIITLIITSQDVAKATGLLIAYAIGAGVPMLLIAYGGQYITTRVRSFSKYTRTIQQVFGILILGLAVAIYFQYDVKLQTQLARHIPGTLSLEKKLVEKYDKQHKLHNETAFQEDEEVIEDDYFDKPQQEKEILSPTSEIFFGIKGIQNLDSTQKPSKTTKNYKLPAHEMQPNTFALEGLWKFDEERITLIKGKGKIKIKFTGQIANLQAQSLKQPAKLRIKEKGEIIKELDILKHQQYFIYKDNEETKEHILEIEVENSGLDAFYLNFE